MAQTLHWPRHHAVEASALATLLLHLHEGFERRLDAAERLRQQRAIKPVVDQRRTTGWRQTPRPLDLVGFARDQGASARARSTRSIPGSLFMRFLAPRLDLAALRWRRRNGEPSAAVDQGSGRLPACRAVSAALRSSDGCAGRRFRREASAIATAARPMPNEPT